MTSLVLQLEVLDTFRYQRPKTCACHLIVIKYSSCGRMKDVLREKFRSFGEQNASHLSVNLQVHGLSGLRRLLRLGNPSDWYPALRHLAGCVEPSPVAFPLDVSTSTLIFHGLRVTSSPQQLPSGNRP
jgi:hypothetical protein